MTGRHTVIGTDHGADGLVAVNGTLSGPLTAPSRVDDIEGRLVTAIALGEYLPGARLPAERDLASALGVGRVTVRQALGRLAERGLLETHRGRAGGWFVRRPDDAAASTVPHELATRLESLRDNVDAISRLHGSMAEAAAENRTDGDIVALRELLAGYRDAASGIDAQRADGLLHLAIMDAAHSPVLKEVLLQLESRVSIGAPNHLWGTQTTMREREARASVDHGLLIEAICAGDREGARTIARQHVLIDIEIIEAALDRG
ncbi:MAG: GntR family transcriptional regulator [Gordonia sp. (in: high G+C Gram-positive bacteria)]